MNQPALRRATSGMIVPLFTPYTEEGEVDAAGLAENVRFLRAFAEDGDRDVCVLANGSTAENYVNSPAEARTTIETVVDVSGDVPVLVGVGGSGTREVIEMSQTAVEMGADGLLAITPYYRSPTEEGLYRHFERVADAVDVGVAVYDNPDVAGATIPPTLLERLSRIENVVAVKDGTPTIVDFYAKVRRVDADDMVLLASGGGGGYVAKAAMGDTLDRRPPGFFSVIGNFAPALDYELYEAVEAGEFDRAEEVLQTQDPFWSFVGEVEARRDPTTVLPAGWATNHLYLPVGKAALDLVGLHGGPVRLPEVNLTDEERATLADILDGMDVL